MLGKKSNPAENLAQTLLESMSESMNAYRDKSSYDRTFFCNILGINQKFVDGVSNADKTELINKFSIPETVEEGEENYYTIKLNGVYYVKQSPHYFLLYEEVNVRVPNGSWDNLYIEGKIPDDTVLEMPEMFVSVTEPEDTEEQPVKEGDCWVKVNNLTDKDIQGFYVYENVGTAESPVYTWSLLFNVDNEQTAQRKIYVQSNTPTGASKGDIWLKTATRYHNYDTNITNIYEYNTSWVLKGTFNNTGASLTNGNEIFNDYTNNNITNSQYCTVKGSNNSLDSSFASLVGGLYNNRTGIKCSIIWGTSSIAAIPSPITENIIDSIITGQGHTIYPAVSRSIICGHFNRINQMQDGIVGGSYASAISTDRLVIGNGTQQATNNALRLDKDGVLYVHQVIPGGADYAETYEWLDGNPQAEERTGLFVTLDGDKIILADSDSDYILGVVSATPTVCGDTYDSYWHGKFECDVFGRILKDKNGDMIVSEKYDSGIEYIPQSKRPEKAAVGTHGKLVVVDDGTCRVNGYCRPTKGGIATASAEKTDYRVIERRDENHVRIVIK